MDLREHIIATLKTITPWQMAEATHHHADNDEAMIFYRSILGDVVDALGEDGEISEEQRDEIADGGPSLWNQTRMLELTGTRSYFDTPEIGDGQEDILTTAGYVLYQLARDVVTYLLEQAEDAKTTYADQE
jgi:hypothetical protein